MSSRAASLISLVIAASLVATSSVAHADSSRLPVHMAAEGSASHGTTDVPAPAWPLAEDGEDVVLLKNGGMVRGYLEELLPGERARIRLVSGEVSVIPWERIDHVEQGHGPMRPAPTVVTIGAAAAAPPPPPVTGSAVVHIEGGAADITLEEQWGNEWRMVCNGSCDREVPLDGYYRIKGSDVRASKIFRLLAKPGEHVVLTVDTASETGHGLGVVAVTIAGIAGSIAYCGLVVSLGDDSTYRHDSNEGLWGATMLGAGVLAVAGVGLLVANSHTDLKQHVVPAGQARAKALSPAPAGVPTAREPSEAARHAESGSRATPKPAWQTAQRDLASLPIPRATTVPLLAMRF